MKRKVGEDKGGGGDSELSDREAKRRKNSKIKGGKERKTATWPRSDHRWSRSRPRSPKRGGERLRWAQEVSARCFWKGLFFGERERNLAKRYVYNHIDTIYR